MKSNTTFKTCLALLPIVLQGTILASETTDQIRKQLEEMHGKDQSIRKELKVRRNELKLGSPESKTLWEEQRKNDDENIRKLEEIIEKHGWPKRSEVGPKAASAAFLIVQHSDLEYQKKYLPFLKKAVAANEAEGRSLALLEDRILMKEGKNQIYGSQLRSDGNGPLRLWPIEDELDVDKRRASVGMEPLADYLARFGLEYQKPKVTNQSLDTTPVSAPR